MHYINFFGIQFNVNPVAFTLPILGGWNVYWYGIIITFGAVLAGIYGLKRAKSFGINSDNFLTVILITAVLSVLSGRLYYIAFYSEMGLADFFKIHDGGLAIPGAIIGAVVFGAIMCKLEKIDILSAFDLASIGFLIGQSIGRWGNFINQEAYGTFTGSSWFGMTGDVITRDMGSVQFVHPCFLYESIWCALGFVLLHLLSYKRKFKGELACIYMIWYGLGRFVIEGLRTDALMLGSVRITQWLSFLACIAGVVLLVVGLKKAKKKPVAADSEYSSLLGEEAAAEFEKAREAEENNASEGENTQDECTQEDKKDGGNN